MTDTHSVAEHSAEGAPGGFDPLASPVIILGLHRSGTTLLYEALSRAGCWNSVWAWHVISFDDIELSPADQARSRSMLADRIASAGIRTRSADEVAVSTETKEEYGFILNNRGYGSRISARNFAFFRRVCAAIQATHPEPRPLLLKNPWDFGNAPLIKRLIPTARFIYIHRNPAETVSSMWKYAKHSILETIPYEAMLNRRYERFTRSRVRLGVSRFLVRSFPKTLVRGLIRWCGQQCDSYLRAVDRIPASDRVEISYDNLCRDPDRTIRRILDHFRLAGRDCDYSSMIRRRTHACDEIVVGQTAVLERRLASYRKRCDELEMVASR